MIYGENYILGDSFIKPTHIVNRASNTNHHASLPIYLVENDVLYKSVDLRQSIFISNPYEFVYVDWFDRIEKFLLRSSFRDKEYKIRIFIMSRNKFFHAMGQSKLDLDTIEQIINSTSDVLPEEIKYCLLLNGLIDSIDFKRTLTTFASIYSPPLDYSTLSILASNSMGSGIYISNPVVETCLPATNNTTHATLVSDIPFKGNPISAPVKTFLPPGNNNKSTFPSQTNKPAFIGTPIIAAATTFQSNNNNSSMPSRPNNSAFIGISMFDAASTYLPPMSNLSLFSKPNENQSLNEESLDKETSKKIK